MKNNLFRKKDIAVMLREAEGSEGGLKRTLSAFNLVTLGIGAIIGTGIFVITGQAAANFAGPALTISFFISALGCIFAGFCYAEFASMIPVSGSVYAYSYTTMGELPAWFIGWTLVLEYLFCCSSVAVGWSGYMLSLLNSWGIHLSPLLSCAPFDQLPDGTWIMTGSIINFPAVFIIVLVAALLMGGMRQSSTVNNVIVVVKVSVILLFIAFGISYIDTSNFVPYIPANTGEYGHYGWSGIFRGAGVVFFAYLGFDALSTVAQEARNPQRNMPIGILTSLLICTVLYIIVTTVLTGMVNYKELAVDAPIALAIDKAGMGLAWLSPFIKLGAIVGLSSVILVMMMGQSRIYYAISYDGLLPSFFSRVHARRGVPHNAIIFSAVVTGIIGGLLPLHVLSQLVSIGTLLAFTVVCIAIVVLRKTQPHLKRPFKTPFVPVLPLAGAAICLLQMVSLPWETWVRLIAWTLLGMVIYFFYGRRNSRMQK